MAEILGSASRMESGVEHRLFVSVSAIYSLILSSGVQCQDPISPAGGYIEVSNFNGQYEFGSVASYRCNAGHVLWGNSSRYHSQQRNSKRL